EKKEQSILDQLEFIHGNAMDIPFHDNTFDYVTIIFVLLIVLNYETVLKEMYIVVKPGGNVVCLETSQPTLSGYRQLYYIYFRFFMSIYGKLYVKSYDEYAWLHESVKNFPNKQILKKMFLSTGFSNVEMKSYTGGVAAMHLATK